MNPLWLILFVPLLISVMWGLTLRTKTYEDFIKKSKKNKD